MSRDLGHRPEPVGATLGDGIDVDELVTGRGGLGVEPSQPQEVVDDVAQALALAVHPLEGVAIRVARRGACSGPGSTSASMTLSGVRSSCGRVGRELELAPAGLFDRARAP